MSTLSTLHKLVDLQEAILDAYTPETATELHLQAVAVLQNLASEPSIPASVRTEVRQMIQMNRQAAHRLQGFKVEAVL